MEKLKEAGEQKESGNTPCDGQSEYEGFDRQKAAENVEAKRRELNEQLKEKAEEFSRRIEELKTAEVPEGKFKLPADCFDDLAKELEYENEHGFSNATVRYLDFAVGRLEKLDGNIDKEIGEKLWALFSDPEISLGIHGTVDEVDSPTWSSNGPIFRTGLGCGYKDLRRTVAFQDRGKIHAHGDISFPGLLAYNYPAILKKQPLTLEKTIAKEEAMDGKTHTIIIHRYETVEVPAKQYSAIVAIPKNVETTDPSLRGEEITVKNNNAFKKGQDKKARTIKGEFIVGIVSDSDPNTIVWNPDFDAEQVKEFGRLREAELQEEAAQAERARNEELEKNQQAAATKPTGFIGKVFGRFFKK